MAFNTVPISLPNLQLTQVDDDDSTTTLPLPSSVRAPLPSARFRASPSSDGVSSVAATTSPVAATSSSVSATPSSSSARSVPSTSSTHSTISTLAPSQVAANDPTTTRPKSGPDVGLVLGVVFGLLVLLALALFLVRFIFIRRRHQGRDSGQRLAYSKARFTISAPTNFTVVESGTFGADGAASLPRPGTSMSIQSGLEDRSNGGDGERVGSPERMRERYPFEAMSGLESGLKDQMQTMKTAHARKPVPAITVEADTR